MGLASPETQRATCEQATPQFSYRSKKSAPEECPGGKVEGCKTRREEGWKVI